ncbi:MAG TPA: sigma-70 family RNA polymerase sigma factor [Acidimicrobiales bacterium]|nr:sigma-70 family RNA polymerase sigma factor [Acidimicrobiales bacterium]
MPTGTLASLGVSSDEWLKSLTGEERDAAVVRLHGLLVWAARREVYRRGNGWRVTGPELDDLAFQAAADALVSVLAKLDQFRGESRFTTWAYKFVMFEVSTKLARHFWRRADAPSAPVDWGRLEARLGVQPDQECEGRELLAALVGAIRVALTERQREVFVAIVIEGIPLDALVVQVGSTRNAIYKMLFDARRNLRTALVDGGYLALEHEGT